MTRAFVLGNGISRRSINLTELSLLGAVYGCNALYREHVPDVLVATDRPIAEHIQRSGYSVQHRFYTRRPLPDLGAHKVPAAYFGYSSGPIAVALAAQDQHRRIYLLGFDLGPATNNSFNNVYAGTEFYKPVDAPPTYSGNWVKQLIRIAKDHPGVEFMRVAGSTTARLAELEALPNLDHVELDSFVDRINNKKDL